MMHDSATERTLNPPPAPSTDGGVLRRRLFVAGTLLTTFVCGGIVGATSMLYFGQEGRHHWPPPHDDPPRRMLTQLQKKLSLDEVQSAEVGKILRDHWEQLEEFRREASPRIEASFEKMHEDVSSALKSGQRPAWDEHFNQMKRGFPPHGRGGPHRDRPPPDGPHPDGHRPDGPPPN